HVAVTFDGTNLKLYVDGALDGRATSSGNPVTNNAVLTIASGGQGTFNGLKDCLIDEAGIYNRALTAGGIKSIYVASSAANPNAPGSECDLRQRIGGRVDPWHRRDPRYRQPGGRELHRH